jgi:hypothetical protein
MEFPTPGWFVERSQTYEIYVHGRFPDVVAEEFSSCTPCSTHDALVSSSSSSASVSVLFSPWVDLSLALAR